MCLSNAAAALRVGGWPGAGSCAALGDHGRRVAAGKPWRDAPRRMHGERCAISATINVRLPGRPPAAMRRPRLTDAPMPGSPSSRRHAGSIAAAPSANTMLNKKNVGQKKQSRIF